MSKILYVILGSIFQTLAATVILFNQDNNLSLKTLKKFIILMFLENIINATIVPNKFRFIFTISSLVIVIYFILKFKDKRAILYSFFEVIILSFSEIFIGIIMVITGIDSIVVVNNNKFNLIANIFISIFAILFSSIPIIKKTIRKLNMFFLGNKKSFNIFYLIILILYFIVLKNGYEFINITSLYYNIFIMLGFIILFMLIVIKENKSNHLEEVNKQSMNYIKKYEKIITEQGKANHEFKNQLMVIKGYAQMNSTKLIDYLNTLIEDDNKLESTYLISQLNKFPDGGIKGLLYYKLSIMEECKIKYNIYSDEKAKKKFKNMSVDQINNITKVIGVMLDNAIEATNKTTNKSVNISLVNCRGKVNFIIENTFKGNIVKEKIGTGYTTKGKGHGYGLQLTKDIINNKDYLNYNFIIDKNLYISNLEIYTGKKTYKK